MLTLRADEVGLQGGSALLVDLTSMEMFSQVAQDLGDMRSVPGYANQLSRGVLWTDNWWIQQVFEILVNLICFDRLLVDKRALASFRKADQLKETLEVYKLHDYFAEIDFDEGVYVSAAESVSALRISLLEHAPKKLRKLLRENDFTLEGFLGFKETMGVDDAIYKDMLDSFERGAGRSPQTRATDFQFPAGALMPLSAHRVGRLVSRSRSIPAHLADTGMSIERLFVYLEAARSIGIPATLDRSKYGALEQVGNRVSRAVGRILKKEIKRLQLDTDTGLEMLQSAVQKHALPRVKLRAPLLPSHVVRFAETRKCSIIDAVKFIRDDPAAGAFREYLWTNRKALNPIYADDYLKSKNFNENLAEMGRRIARYGSSTGVFRDMRTLIINTSNIPYLGDILKMIGLSKTNIRFSLPRHPPLYEVFIARWFA